MRVGVMRMSDMETMEGMAWNDVVITNESILDLPLCELHGVLCWCGVIHSGGVCGATRWVDTQSPAVSQ